MFTIFAHTWCLPSGGNMPIGKQYFEVVYNKQISVTGNVILLVDTE